MSMNQETQLFNGEYSTLKAVEWHTEIPRADFADADGEHTLRVFSYPVVSFTILLVALIIGQAFVPPPRIGVDSLWDANLRVIVGIVAVLPSIITCAVQARSRYLIWKAPRMAMASVFVSALFGSFLALALAWALGAELNPGIAIAAFATTVIWIWVTGVVAAYIAGQARVALNIRRAKRLISE